MGLSDHSPPSSHQTARKRRTRRVLRFPCNKKEEKNASTFIERKIKKNSVPRPAHFFIGAKNRNRTCESSIFFACAGFKSLRASMTSRLRMLWSRSVS